jgi:uncharacterized protein DUF551
VNDPSPTPTLWIKANDRLPEKDGRYLVVEKRFGNWRGVSSYRAGHFDFPVTHWMPLPELPSDLIE